MFVANIVARDSVADDRRGASAYEER